MRKTQINTYENDDYVFFWGSIFSNWAKCTFIHEGLTYTSAEQTMMAAKAKLFGDVGSYYDIINTDNPEEQKAIGKTIIGYDDAKWAAVRYRVVADAIYSKFSQNKEFSTILLETGNKKIVEASPYDKIWGIGMHASDPDILDESKWKGENLLGKALMEVRDRLRKEYNEIFC